MKETSVSIDGVQAVIRIEYLPNTSLKHYLFIVLSKDRLISN
jgi:hypothetical protein